MKNRRKNQLLSFIICVALFAGSLAPVTTVQASELPAVVTTPEPTPEPTEEPSPTPEEAASETPTEIPSEENEAEPTQSPSEIPSSSETPSSSEVPSVEPSAEPSAEPSVEPSDSPSAIPSESPEVAASASPDASVSPDVEASPSASPSASPTATPSPTVTPSASPSPSPEASVEDLDYILGRPMTEEEKEAQRALVPDVLIDLPKEEPVESFESLISFFNVLPEQYDSRDYGYMTSVKDQNPYGSCWTYATMASMESSLIMQDVVEPDEIDLSEWHLAYFATHTGSDELGNTKGDYVKTGAGVAYMNNGGNAQMSMVALSNWKGVTNESDYSGNTDPAALDVAGRTLKADDAWKNNRYYMDNCYMTPASDLDSVKQLIQAFGAVYGSYYHHDSYYNFDTAAYYCDVNGTNHAITVVGWDDTYKKENFSTVPEGDGAWICKNSWGSGWGDEGYFYISYYDTSFAGSNAAAFEAKEIEEGLSNYYYGGGVDVASYIWTEGIAQCYTAKANHGGSEKIVGTGFATYHANVEYSVQIYKNPEVVGGVVENPLSGEAVWEQPEEGVTTYAGYHSIDFGNPVEVHEGDIFAVVITFGEEISVLVDATYALSNGYSYVYDSYNVTKEGESFSKMSGFNQYICMHDEEMGLTPRMNVFTQKEKVVKAYREGAQGDELLGEYYSVQKAIDAVAEADVQTDDAYRIELLRDVTAVDTLVIPEGIGSLTITGNTLTIKADHATKIKTASDLNLRNITLAVQMQSEDETVKIQAADCRLTLQDGLYFVQAAELVGDKATLQIAGNVVTQSAQESLQGSINGFAKVVIDVPFTLGSFISAGYIEQNADATFMGNVTADEYELGENCTLWIGSEEEGADAKITNLRALSGSYLVASNNLALQDVTLFGTQLQAAGKFTMDGLVVSEGEGNRLITLQKKDESGTVRGVRLEIGGKVFLSDENAQIEILVKNIDAGSGEDGADNVTLYGAPAATALLVHTTEDALCFKPAAENCGGVEAMTANNGEAVYVYYREDVPVEVIKESADSTKTLGHFTTFAKAVKAVETQEDKTASYTFVLYDSLGTEQAIKLNMPTNAASVTVKAAEGLDEKVTLHIAEHVTLSTDTTLEGVVLSPAFNNGSMNLNLSKYDLILRDVGLAENTKINKITYDTKKKATLQLEMGDGVNTAAYEVNSLNVSTLVIGSNTVFTVNGKAAISDLSIADNATLAIGGAQSVITQISSYVPYSEKVTSHSNITIKSNADLTIENDFALGVGKPLYISKESADIITTLEDVNPSARILTAEKAASSAFIVDGIWQNTVCFKHAKGIYAADKEALTNGMLQAELSYGGDNLQTSYFVDWYQVMSEIGRLNLGDANYEVSLLTDIPYTRRLDSEYQLITVPKAFTLPAAGKYSALLVKGNNHLIAYAGDMKVSGQTTLQNLALAPVKVAGGALTWLPGDLVLQADKNKKASLTLQNVSAATNYLPQEKVGTGYLFAEVEGDGKYAQIILTDGSVVKVKEDISGLQGLYLGMTAESVAAGAAKLAVSGKLTTKTLGIWNETANDVNGTSLLVTNQLTVGTLCGKNGILSLRQSSAKSKNTFGKVTGISKNAQDAPLTVLVLGAKVTSVAAYEKKLAASENPYVQEVMEIPLLQASVMSSECIRAALVSLTQDGLSLQMPEDTLYYKDNNQYIRAGEKSKMRIKITASTEDGLSSVSYAANWYKAVQNLNKMANRYNSYTLELLENTTYVTNWNSAKKKEAFGKLILPSKVTGTVEIKAAEGVDASFVYSGSLKVPDKMTLIINGVPFEQQNSKKASVKEVLTLGNKSTLELINVTASCQNLAKISASKGSVVLKNTSMNVNGAINIKNLYVNELSNKISGKSTIQIQFIKPINTGKVTLETVSKYTKKKNGTYKMSQLSQLSVTGAVDEGAQVSLHVMKDVRKEEAGTDAEYVTDALLVQDGESLSARNRLATVKGNASDGRIVLVDGSGNVLSDGVTAFLMTENSGLYLVEEEPIIKVISVGGTTSDYLGCFRTLDAALNAVTASAKKDISISSKNKKEYQVIFLKAPQTSTSCKVPSGAAKIVFTQQIGEEQMPLTVKGSISYKAKKGTVVLDKVALTTSGNVSVTGLVLQSASIETKGAVTLKSLQAENSLLKGKNITVSGLTQLRGSKLYATADNATDTGKLKLNRLTDNSVDGDAINILAAKVNKSGTTQLQITGTVYSLYERTDTEARFAVAIYKNRNAAQTITLAEGTRLLSAPKADAGFFRPAYVDAEENGMVAQKNDFGVYKKSGYIRYGSLAKMTAILINETEVSDADGSGLVMRGSSSAFGTLKEAITEINSRKNKKGFYRILLLEDTEIKTSKGAYTSLTLPSYAKRVILEGMNAQSAESGESDNLVSLSYLGKLTAKCELALSNIHLVPYKKSGKKYKNSGTAFYGAGYAIHIAGQVQAAGSMQIKKLNLAEDAQLYARDGLKATDITYASGSSILIEKEGPVALSGKLIPLAEGDVLTLIVNEVSVSNGTKVISLKSLFGKADLQKLAARDLGQTYAYKLYQDGRAVYVRK